MRKVRILIPVDGYAVGDTPELTGPRVRELIASGHVERIAEGEEPPVKLGHRTRGKRA